MKQIVHGKALLEDNNGEQCVTELPGSVLEKVSGDKDLSVFLKKTLEDVIVGLIPKKSAHFAGSTLQVKEPSIHIKRDVKERHRCLQHLKPNSTDEITVSHII